MARLMTHENFGAMPSDGSSHQMAGGDTSSQVALFILASGSWLLAPGFYFRNSSLSPNVSANPGELFAAEHIDDAGCSYSAAHRHKARIVLFYRSDDTSLSA
jgi:hypothetical protein